MPKQNFGGRARCRRRAGLRIGIRNLGGANHGDDRHLIVDLKLQLETQQQRWKFWTGVLKVLASSVFARAQEKRNARGSPGHGKPVTVTYQETSHSVGGDVGEPVTRKGNPHVKTLLQLAAYMGNEGLVRYLQQKCVEDKGGSAFYVAVRNKKFGAAYFLKDGNKLTMAEMTQRISASVIKLLKNSDEDVRQAAIRCLSSLGEQDFIQILLGRMRKPGHDASASNDNKGDAAAYGPMGARTRNLVPYE
ncbi:hypothetical protein B0H13DRAFT_1855587 [Mycena leptocephala]|nr:hypothetical protein B0H13DRAFT_1855587 [Mycena leptocephala]